MFAVGTNSCSNSSRFGVTSTFVWVTPVTVPPGLFKLATRPSLTGSPETAKTIGIVVVATAAACTPGVFAKITAIRRRTRSAANAGSRSYWPSAQRNSITTFWPSTYPASLRPSRNAVTMRAYWADDALFRNPITGSACCARTTCGHVASAPPRSVMNSRRFMYPRKDHALCNALSLAFCDGAASQKWPESASVSDWARCAGWVRPGSVGPFATDILNGYVRKGAIGDKTLDSK